jgi:signal transduction histidine kinase
MIDAEKISLKNTEAEEVLNILKPFIIRCLRLNHDLNNPLTGIIGYTEFLLDEEEPLSENQREYIEQIKTCSERIENEITELCNEKIVLSQKINLQQLFPAD